MHSISVRYSRRERTIHATCIGTGSAPCRRLVAGSRQLATARWERTCVGFKRAPRARVRSRPAFAAPPFAMAASRDVVSGASARAVRPPVSARACLEHLCRALASLGVGVVPTEDASRGSRDRPRRALTAETLRRAKFDHPDASAPLWRAIHDLFLVCAAGFPNPSVAADALARVRGDADDVEDATCAALARHRLAEAGYPRARDLESLPPRDGRSRPLLLALAWAVHRADVFARAHADAHAPNLASAAPGASRSPLPPYPPDSAASPAAARAAAARALAEERAYVDDARAALDACRDEHDAVGDAGPSSSASAARLGRRREPLPLAARAAARVRAEAARDAGVRAQTPIFAQRLWQTFSHVEALERARASRRVRLRESRREFAASFGDPLLGARATAASFVRVRGVAEPRRGRARCARGGDGGDDGGDPRGVRRRLGGDDVLRVGRIGSRSKTNDATTMTTTKTNRHSQVM